ncbi:NAD(P)H-dependent oxidoreductase [Clostridium estertheticum]|uniref:flavodoxin family protein n=1 Tax=Clostridium estertheticum TaxID=238834 RepID=UPI001C6E5A35|nr:NAD(P)H-dependent oxidoreductase [Clostridium estertheticum]MBW9172438.1 NAD(P)H-dependent oxidoreductase [Clostridium estertheticum]WLC73485.1 NAD(P)H-dependent oxidoreductase [Clostridium estertheticum]
MKILIVNGSAHKGNTWTLVEIIKKHMQEISHNKIVFDEIHLAETNLPFCNGCSSCLIRGNKSCPHHLEVQKFIDKIEENDATIIASPCYANHVTALMKNFIDHLAFNTHRPKFFKNKMLAISTAGGSGAKKCTKYLRETFMCWGFNHGYELPVISNSYGGYKPSQKVVKKCKIVAEKFYIDVSCGKLYSPTFVNLLVYNIFRGMSHSGAKGEFYDNEYWKKTGLVDVAYATEIPLPLYKHVLGNIIYSIAKKIAKKTKVTYKK